MVSSIPFFLLTSLVILKKVYAFVYKCQVFRLGFFYFEMLIPFKESNLNFNIRSIMLYH